MINPMDFRPLCLTIAARYKHTLSGHFDDLVQELLLAVVEEAQKYKPDSEIPFPQVLLKKLPNVASSFYYNNSSVVKKITTSFHIKYYTKLFKFMNKHTYWISSNKEEALLVEFSKINNESLTEVKSLWERMSTKEVSSDEMMFELESECIDQVEYLDTVESVVNQALNHPNKNYAQIFREMYMGDGGYKNNRQVSEIVGISDKRVHQIMQSLIKDLQGILNEH